MLNADERLTINILPMIILYFCMIKSKQIKESAIIISNKLFWHDEFCVYLRMSACNSETTLTLTQREN